MKKYGLQLSHAAMECLQQETPKVLQNVETVITGSVKDLCRAAEEACEALGYETVILTDQMDCEAREAGAFLGAIAKSHQQTERSLAFIAGGETVVHLTGKGKGGRNQELADNNAYHALQQSEGLIMTGATGTNVNDVTVVLIKR